MRLGRWWRRGDAAGIGERRWIVVDTETTGLDPDRDPMLAIGAVAVVDGRLRPSDSFEMLVRVAQAPTAENVLVHGIGRMQRAAGMPLEQAIPAWRAWRQHAPAIGFHAEFDRRVLRAAVRRAGLAPDRRPWLDVEHLAAAIDPDFGARRRSLDEWLAHFGLAALARHTAAGDAWATAELLLRLLPKAARRGASDLPALRRMAQRGQRRRMPLGGGA